MVEYKVFHKFTGESESKSNHKNININSKNTTTMASTKKKDIGRLWITIFIFSIAACISFIFAVFQNEIRFFEDGTWANDGDSIALNRAYLVALLVIVSTLAASSYGFWRQCIPSNSTKTFDELSAGFVTANATLCFMCFIMFISFDVSTHPFSLSLSLCQSLFDIVVYSFPIIYSYSSYYILL